MPIPLALSAERRAIARMHIELSLAFHACIFPLDQVAPSKPDADLTLVAVAVMLGHAEGHPMNATQIAARVQMLRPSVVTRLNELLALGLIRRIKHKYYLEPARAADAPHLDRFELILSEGFIVLGPYLAGRQLSKTDE
ncbi:MarR family transcriptional regulator [Bradyrhizobium elkanii]|uniref:MarR family transcriptional regulator n=1 Tax=Bradyrhizobium elkanii TaxID=29448 RepID=UPI0004AE5FC9|nr:helix-turn-helix domain-containing protein [Bradyrhizobium elkanii]WLA79540.1 helix-turn-helix domain-containing protein [Bradyrhizobium elkanii]